MPAKRPGYVPRILMMSNQLCGNSPWRNHLADAGWRVLETGEIKEAVAAIRADMVDLILVQAPFEGMANMDLPQILRELEPLHRLPVVILADAPSDSDRAGLLNSGADEVIPKSACPAEFVARINAQLRIKNLHDELVCSRQALQEALDRERCLLAKLRRDNAELQVLCTTDPLTRVQNVRSFRDILWHEFKMSDRYNQSVSLLMLDVDHFKLVNDACGHPAGDYVLKELAVILQRSVRQSDVVARTGGEEFSIILPKAGPRQAARFAQRIRREVQGRRFLAYGGELRVTVSVGWCSYPADEQITGPEIMVYLADQALLIAKETGRNRVVGLRSLDVDLRQRLLRQYRQPVLEAETPAADQVQPVETGK